MRKWHIVTPLLLGILLFSLFGALLADAQVQGNQWSPPYRLSGDDTKATENNLVADQYGFVHAVWIETGFFDRRPIIQYARFDGETWTQPMDIYTTLPGTIIDRISLAIDQDNMLHLIWTEGGGYRQSPIMYTYAPAHDASSARNWQEPVRVAEELAHLVKLQVDSNGVLHILYSIFFEPDSGVYYIRSIDQGDTWSKPISLDPDILPGYGPGTLQLAFDETDGLHAVWFYQPIDGFGGDWVRYARSLDGGKTWSIPFTIDQDEEGTGKLSVAKPIMAVSGHTVHVIWAGGDLSYRNHRFSPDAGQTWSAPFRIFRNLAGQAGDGLTVDGAGRVHFVGQIRYPQGIWHAYWDQDHWEGPSLVYLINRTHDEDRGNRIHAHGLRPAVLAGNQLVISFHPPTTDKDGSLYTMHYTLEEVLPKSVEATPVPPPAATPSPEASPTLTPTPTPIATARSFDVNADPILTDLPTVAGTFWPAIIATLLLVGGVIVFHLSQKR